jgi:hypothetical protein
MSRIVTCTGSQKADYSGLDDRLCRPGEHAPPPAIGLPDALVTFAEGLYDSSYQTMRTPEPVRSACLCPRVIASACDAPRDRAPLCESLPRYPPAIRSRGFAGSPPETARTIAPSCGAGAAPLRGRGLLRRSASLIGFRPCARARVRGRERARPGQGRRATASLGGRPPPPGPVPSPPPGRPGSTL